MVRVAQRIQDLKEMAIVIDTWDDVFSDFDPRPLDERTVSGDFIEELKKRYKESKRGSYIITIIAPVQLKNENAEKMVLQRLKRHFLHRHLQDKRQLMKIKRRGLLFVLTGIFSLGFLTMATYFQWFTDLVIELIGILLMPIGWFGIWEGFSKIIETSPELEQESGLFEKLSRAKYQFKYLKH